MSAGHAGFGPPPTFVGFELQGGISLIEGISLMDWYVALIVVLKVLIVIGGVSVIIKTYRHKVIVFEYQNALLFIDGVCRRVLEPGKHVIWGRDVSTTHHDMRLSSTYISPMDFLTSDGAQIRVSMILHYQIVDLQKAIFSRTEYGTWIYNLACAHLREVVLEFPIMEMLKPRPEIVQRVLERLQPAAEECGLRVDSAEVREVTLPPELRKAFSEVHKAQQEGLAALEKSRGEVASLRALANAARMIDDNPNLLQLRLLQVMQETKGNTVIASSGQPGLLPIAPTPKGS